MLRTDPSSSWLFYKITPKVKINHRAPINRWFYFIFGVFVNKMAIIHLESSRNWRIYAQIPVLGLSALFKYRRYSTIGDTSRKEWFDWR